MNRSLRRVGYGLLIVAVLVAVAYQSRHKLHLADFTWRKFVHSVSEANVWLLLLAVVAIYVCYAIRAIRWQRFCRYLGPTGFWNTYNGTLMGFAAVFVLGRAGEPVRPLILARKERLPAAGMFGIYFLERFFDFAAAATLACLSILVFSQQLSDAGADTDWIDSARSGAWILLAALLGLIGLLVYYRLHGAAALDRSLEKWHAAGGLKGRLAAALSGISEGLQAIRTLPDLLTAVAYTAVHWMLIVLVYLWVARAFDADFVSASINLAGSMLLLSITLVGSTLQIPGIGGGFQFATIVALTKIFGVDQEPAVAIALVLWLITFAASTVVGLPLLIHEGMSFGDLRKLAHEEDDAEEAGTHAAVPAPVAAPKPSGKGREQGESIR
jgi:glycosyltransferase 2 family protein